MTDPERKLRIQDMKKILDYVRTHRQFDSLTSNETLAEVEVLLDNWGYFND